MKTLKLGLLAIVAMVSASSVTAQTADEIVSKHFEALGGKAKIAEIKTLHTESNFEIAGQSAPSVTTIVNGKGFRNEVDFGGQKMIQVVTDKSGWMINPMTGQSTATPLSDEQFKLAKQQIFIGGPLYNYAEKGNKVELAGREDVNGVNTYKLKMTTADKAESFYYIDPTKYYIVKQSITAEVNGEKAETITLFSDYKKTDFGYVVPYKMEIQLPQISLVSTVNKVEINKPVAETIFNQG
jgi:outer membrane lipoprotein-sorting protein